MITDVFVSVGSNVDRVHHIRNAVLELRRRFGPVALSSVFESEAVGFVGEPFLNLVAAFATELCIDDLLACLRRIESDSGRDPNAPSYSARTLDLDLLLYGESVLKRAGLELPRGDITTRAFVLGPLAEIAGERRHPVDGRKYAELWAGFDEAGAAWKVDFDFGAI